MSKSWYGFIGGEDTTNPSNYYNLSGGGKHQCLCGTTICAIYATKNGVHPEDSLSSNLQHYIMNALVKGQLQPETPYGAKKYVYLRY